jgi:hypothetical protein
MDGGMNTPAQSAQLPGRRRRLGASRETMAAGLGLDVDVIRAIEDGAASEEQSSQYVHWLDRIESWPAEHRTQQLLSAGKGRPFDPGDAQQ